MRALAIALFVAAAATAQASVVDRKRASRNLQDDVTQDKHQDQSKYYKDGCGLRGQLCCHTIGEDPEQPPCLHGLGCEYYDEGDAGYELGVCTSECGGENEPCCNSVISTDGDSTCDCAPGLFYNIDLNMCKPCGSLGNTPCPDVGCNAGLVPDGTGWYQIDRRRSLAAEDRKLGWGQVILYDEVCVPCGGEGQIPCPACDGCEGAPSGTCNEGLSPHISYEYSGITLCLPCGTFGAPPCPDVGCNTGLVSDGTGWFFLSQGLTADPIALTLFGILFNEFADGIFGRRLSETTTSTLEGSKNKRRLGEIWTGDHDNSPPAVCVPCGELAQIPCPPCEGSCATCSEGHVATNLLGYLEAGEGGDFNTTDIPLDEIDGFLSLLVGLNICLPCGAEGQPPCEDTKCNHGLAPDINDGGKCVKCGRGGQPPCEDGCASGFSIDPDIVSTKCQACGNLGEIPCIDTEGPASSICNEGLSPQFHPEFDMDKTLCLPCGSGIGELPCPGTECASGLTPDGFGWFNLASNPEALAFLFQGFGDDFRRLSETPATFAATNKRRLGTEGNGEPGDYPLGLCAPCGEFGQIPCAPCEGSCATCSEGLIATNPLSYLKGDIIDGPGDNTTAPDPEFLSFVVGINICLPCGAEGQPPCEDAGCNPGLIPDIDDGTCVKCGRKNQPPCEDGCDTGFSINPTFPMKALCSPCGGYEEPCCCDSSEYDSVFSSFQYFVGVGTGAPESIAMLGAEMLKAAIENANNDPSKCLVGCASGLGIEAKVIPGAALRCGANGMCFSDVDAERTETAAGIMNTGSF